MWSGTRSRRALTIVELLVVLAIIGTLLAILLPVVLRARATARGTHCLNNLRQIALGFQFYADAHRQRFPRTSELSWELQIAPHLEMQQSTFYCPEDVDNPEGLSYDWRDDVVVLPQAELAGKRIDRVAGSDLALVFDQEIGWHHPESVNVATVGAATMSMDELEFERNLLLSADSGEFLLLDKDTVESLLNDGENDDWLDEPP